MTTTQNKPTKARWPWVLLGAFVLTATYHGCTGNSTPPPPPQQRGPGLSENSKTTLAAIINVRGELCAQVTAAKPLGNDVYEVSCQRYRDGTGMATYQVNVNTGQVK